VIVEVGLMDRKATHWSLKSGQRSPSLTVMHATGQSTADLRKQFADQDKLEVWRLGSAFKKNARAQCFPGQFGYR
jgi:hypothetical protein